VEFHNFLKFIPKIAKETLPATNAHAKMAPIGRMDILEKLTLDNQSPKRAAVMMLFYPKQDETHLVLIVRNSYPGVHSSQIAFPGGKVELSDKNLEETALRETEEEIGVKKHQIEVIRAFTEVYIPPSNFLVSPFLGICNATLQFSLQEDEVAGIIEFPLKDFLNDEIIVTRRLKTSYSVAIDVPAFLVKEHVVWGATAMMLSELKDTIIKVM
jgi:8-oxo-dGTP pyrophosphatase MutT (NUDIX family)